MIKYALAIVMVLALTACGGGSGGGQPAASVGPTAADITNASAAKVTARLDLATGLTTLSWTDTFPNASSYTIEQESGDAWTSVGSVAGQQGSNQTLQWTSASTGSATLRVSAAMSGYSVVLNTKSQQVQLAIIAPDTPLPTIQLGSSEPVSGTVQILIGHYGSYTDVDYFVDQVALDHASVPDYSVFWDTSKLNAGSHAIEVDLHPSEDVALVLQRNVNVGTAQVSVGLTINNHGGSTQIQGTASSDFGITSVTASVDGVPTGTLASPNNPGYPPHYYFDVTPNPASGFHDFTVQATDANGQTATLTRSYKISNPPVLNVNSAFDGQLVNGTLPLSGTFSTDKSGSLTLTATLGNTTILTTTQSPFSLNYDISVLAPGNYVLGVSVTDKDLNVTSYTAQITVTSSAALVYPIRASLGTSGLILAVDKSGVLYTPADQSVHWLTGSGDTVLTPPAGLITNSAWFLGNGNAYAVGLDPASPAGAFTLYQWQPGVANAQKLGQQRSNFVTVHWPWLLTRDAALDFSTGSSGQHYQFFNIPTGQTLSPTLNDATALGGADFYIDQGSIVFYYPISPASGGSTSSIGIQQWSQSTNQSTPIASDPTSSSLQPQTDGSLLAWQTNPGRPQAPFDLTVMSIATSVQQSLSTTMNLKDVLGNVVNADFQLRDGLLAWSESTATQSAIKAYDGTTVNTVSPRLSGVLYGTGGGYVLFSEDSKLYVWSAAGGKQLILDVMPYAGAGNVQPVPQIAGKSVFFTNSQSQALYWVNLP